MTKKISISLVASFLIATYSQANSQNLGSIEVISATKSNQSIKDVTSNVEVITGAELEEKNITTLTQALNLVSGISFTSNGGLGKQTSVYLRGFDSKRVLVLIDGVRYNDITGASGASFENLMINDIEQIEIIKGAQSGIWGSDASAGVINIITKGATKGLHGSVLAEYGSFNTKKYNIATSYKTDKFYFKVNHQKLTTNGFTAYAKKGEDINKYEDDGYENKTTNFRFGLNIDDNNKIDMSHMIIDTYNEYDNTSSDNLNNYSISKTKISGARFENVNEIAITDLTYNKTDFFRSYRSHANTTTSDYDGNLDEFGLKSKIDYLDETSFVIVGGDYKKFEQLDTLNKDYTNKALFLTNSNKFDKLIFTQSLRADKYDAFDNKTTGKIGAKYNINDDLALFANYGTAYNVPTLGQLFGKNGPNPNLKPETTKSTDVGFEYMSFKATYFSNKIDDMIEWSNSKYNNVQGTSKLKGFELDYKKEIYKSTLLNLSYTQLSAKDKDGKSLARRAKESLKFGVDYYGLTNLHLGLYGEYIGTRYNLADDKGEQTGRYTIANMVVNYDIFKNTKIYAKVDNITNKYYQTIENYATSPRAYYAGIKVSF
ncbi:TonB-dependent receptor plug domain-containing protein [Arcobacter sp. FWKO B]|uniref:TonB-dependent receptor plug domain-containing protein n=1 Tax=Arcobacter sp. FWKO B TaxID=2593672 RepID=UPI0018A36AA7|nr:TonB-dependent receptor [Arcobacter sp. FWKO B]QOG12474.1 TonB-dependent receptor [Arcobacter sp. FWKO B]